MPISDKAFERLDRGIRTGLGILAEQERYKKQEERMGKQEERAAARESREAAIFDQSQEDRKNKKAFELGLKKMALAEHYLDLGKEKESINVLKDVFNRDFPNGDEANIIYRPDLDQTDNQALIKLRGMLNQDPKMKDSKIIAFTRKDKAATPFKDARELMDYAKALYTPENYLAANRYTDKELANLNNSAKTFVGSDGKTYKERWIKGEGGIPVKTDPVLVTGATPATEMEQKIIGIGQAETAIGKKLTPEEKKESLLGIKQQKTTGKSVTQDKKFLEYSRGLDLVLTPFAEKGKTGDDSWMFEDIPSDETGETKPPKLSLEGSNAMQKAINLVRKYESGEKLSESESSLLKYARRALEYYNNIIDIISPAKKQTIGEKKSPGLDWRQYRSQQTPSLPMNTRPAIPLTR